MKLCVTARSFIHPRDPLQRAVEAMGGYSQLYCRATPAEQVRAWFVDLLLTRRQMLDFLWDSSDEHWGEA